MNKTKVDDILIEMIKPKLEEIEKRFSNGEGLKNDDINTLLLKSQYNHINHLDEKLNEITEDVSKLRFEFDKFKVEMVGDFNGFKGEVRGELDEFKIEIRKEFDEFKIEIRKEFNEFKTEVKEDYKKLETKFDGLEKKFNGLEVKFANMETNIQKTIVNTMKWYIGGFGVIIISLKILDIFIK